MKIILNYSNFSKKIYEGYEEDPENKIKRFFVELEKNIRFWFDEGSFGANDAILYDIKVSTTNNVDKTLIFDFQDTEFYYQIIIIVTLQEVGEDSLSDCHIKVKKYDSESSELLREIGEDVMIKDLNEEKILEIISKLDEESTSLISDIDTNPEISDEDSNLEDTDTI